MSEPIKSGDVCLVIQGLGRIRSPNLGKTVSVKMCMGEHSEHGRIWRCQGDGVTQLHDNGSYIVTGWADFPTSWLQKIDAPKGKAKEKQKELTE
jgi:hypothetical protein